MYKAAILLAVVGIASAGAPLAYAPAAYAAPAYVDHHVGAQSEQTVRGFGGLSSVSHQARQVNSLYSTSSAYKSKATNAAVYAPAAYATHAVAAPVAYHQPAVQYAAPAYAHAVAAPAPVLRQALPVARAVGVGAPAGLLGVQYSPVVPGVATLTFDGFGVHYGY